MGRLAFLDILPCGMPTNFYLADTHARHGHFQVTLLNYLQISLDRVSPLTDRGSAFLRVVEPRITLHPAATDARTS